MDITYFMTWFSGQVVKIFSWMFNILDSITFAGTSLLRVIVTIIILSVLIPVIFTIGKGASISAEMSERVHEENRKRRIEDDKDNSTSHRAKQI